MADETVFDVFPHAIEQVTLITISYSTIEGNIAKAYATIDAIIDEEASTDFNNAPNSAPAYSSTLLYVRPEQLPTIDCAQLQASYGIKMHGRTYSIESAGIGKNQETGRVEHVELIVRQRSTIEGDESE